MKKLLSFFALMLIALCVSGCGMNSHLAYNRNQSQTQVVLQGKNFRVLGEASGTAQATYICGIGGLSKAAMQSNAVAQMFRSARLSGSQTIVNINIHQHIGGLPPFYWTVKHVATGQIIEFTE